MLDQYPEEMKPISTLQLQTDESGHLQNSIDIPPDTNKHYGKLKVFADGKIHLSVGPDYIFSIVALGFLVAVAYGLYKIQNLIEFSTVGKVIHTVFIFFPPLAFLATLCKNPGIYDPEQNFQPKRTYCNVCKHFIPKSVFHCKYCGVCIEEYDHHCPWLSKCIGKKNLTLFYLFVGSIPVTFFYFCFLIYWMMTHKKT